MALTEAEIINATLEFISRNRYVAVVTILGYDIVPIFAVLLAYEEEMRKLHEANP